MLNKLKEFNAQVPPENIVRNEADLDALRDLVECRIDKLEENHVRTLETLLQWPNGELMLRFRRIHEGKMVGQSMCN